MLGYLAADGRPLVAPVWFVVDGDQLVFTTGRDTSKGRALARDPLRVSTAAECHLGRPVGVPGARAPGPRLNIMSPTAPAKEPR